MRKVVLFLALSALVGGVAFLAAQPVEAHHLGNAPSWIGVNVDRVHGGDATFVPDNFSRPSGDAPPSSPDSRPTVNQVNRPDNGSGSGAPTQTRPDRGNYNDRGR